MAKHCHCPRHDSRHSDMSVGCDHERSWDMKECHEAPRSWALSQPMTTPTPEEIAARHMPEVDGGHVMPNCMTCRRWGVWPCDTARMAEAWRAERGKNTAAIGTRGVMRHALTVAKTELEDAIDLMSEQKLVVIAKTQAIKAIDAAIALCDQQENQP